MRTDLLISFVFVSLLVQLPKSFSTSHCSFSTSCVLIQKKNNNKYYAQIPKYDYFCDGLFLSRNVCMCEWVIWRTLNDKIRWWIRSKKSTFGNYYLDDSFLFWFFFVHYSVEALKQLSKCNKILSLKCTRFYFVTIFFYSFSSLVVFLDQQLIAVLLYLYIFCTFFHFVNSFSPSLFSFATTTKILVLSQYVIGFLFFLTIYCVFLFCVCMFHLFFF